MGNTVSYLRGGKTESLDVQQVMVAQFAEQNHFVVSHSFVDCCSLPKRKACNREVAEKIGFSGSFSGFIYPELENLLLEVFNGQISTVLVDTAKRLFPNSEYRRIVEKIFTERGVEIVEIREFPASTSVNTKTVVVYHAFSASEERTGPLLNAVDDMYQYAMIMYPEAQIQLRFSSEIQDCDDFQWIQETKPDVLLVKYFFHIRRKTGSCLSQIKEFQQAGIEVVSMNEGKIYFKEMGTALLKEPYKAIGFERMSNKSSSEDIQLSLNRFRLFVKRRAVGWRLEDVIVEKVDAKAKWDNISPDVDLIMVNSFSTLEVEVSKFIKIMKSKNALVFSLQKGEVCSIGEK